MIPHQGSSVKKNRVDFNQEAAYSEANKFIGYEHIGIGCYWQSVMKKIFINIAEMYFFVSLL